MEKGRTYFEQDVAFMHEMGFDTVKIDQCGSAMNMSLWAALINATGRSMMLENCHNAPSWWSPVRNSDRNLGKFDHILGIFCDILAYLTDIFGRPRRRPWVSWRFTRTRSASRFGT